MRRQQRNQGQGLVEFALLIPLVIFMLFIFIDLAWMISSYLQLSSSVREVTRYAMVHPFIQSEIEDLVKEKTTSLDPNRIDFLRLVDVYDDLSPDLKTLPLEVLAVYTPMIVENPANQLDQIIIIASYRYQPITPGLNLIRNPENPILLRVQSSATLAPSYQD